MTRGRAFWGALVVVLLGAGTAQAEEATFTERHTKTTFEVRRTIGGTPFLLTGAGARRAAGMINVYGAGMYVHAEQGPRQWLDYLTGRFAQGGLVTNGQPDFQRLPSSAELRHFIVYGRFPRAIDMSFVRDVSADQVRGAYEEGWTRVNLDRAAAGTALDQFMAAISHPVSNGQHMIIRTAGNNVWVDLAGQTTQIQANRALVIAIWKIWFGQPCLQAPLRDGMLSQIENVHRASQALPAN